MLRSPVITAILNSIYSVQRIPALSRWPRRAGRRPVRRRRHVPPLHSTTRYGYSEQIVVHLPYELPAPQDARDLFQNATGTINYPATQSIYHTMGWANEMSRAQHNSLAEPWDYFPFNDRDFTSVAELLLVPAARPGLFTKQFARVRPVVYNNIANILANVTPLTTTHAQAGTPATYMDNTTVTTPLADRPDVLQPDNTASDPAGSTLRALTPPPPPPRSPICNFTNSGGTSQHSRRTVQPHTFPYLTTSSSTRPTAGHNTLGPGGGLVGGYAADGWFKMFEFFEVPSQMFGAIGPVARGTNFDWARQDHKPAS